MISKRELRQNMLHKRSELNSASKKKLDDLIYEKLISDKRISDARVIFIYVSYRDEVDTINFINYCLSKQKNVCVPKIISLKEGMKAVKIFTLNDLKPNKMGILEPKNIEYSVSPEELEMILLPGLAFDNEGGRLGYGGGFYDKFLSDVPEKVIKLGLGYSFQVLDKVPMEQYDKPIDGIITD